MPSHAFYASCHHVILTDDCEIHAVDLLPPTHDLSPVARHQDSHRLQTHIKSLFRHILHHPLGTVNAALFRDRMEAFSAAERAFELASAARQRASDALLDAMCTSSTDEIDRLMNEVIASFTMC